MVTVKRSLSNMMMKYDVASYMKSRSKGRMVGADKEI